MSGGIIAYLYTNPATMRSQIVLYNMRSILILTSTVVVTVVGAVSVGRANQRRVGPVACPPARARVLVRNSQAVVYAHRPMFAGEQVAVSGCVRGGARTIGLGETEPGSCAHSGCGGSGEFTLAGVMVAYDEGFSSEQAQTDEVVVRNLRTGRVVHKAPTGTVSEPEPNESDTGVGPVYRLVLQSDGAVAWTVNNEGIPRNAKKQSYYEVHAVDKVGNRVLAKGYDVNPGSLKLGARGHLSWLQGGKTFSATLK